MNINTITAKASGGWHNIIQSLTGVELLPNKHSPCPICGGKDRFRFDNQEGRGTYICNQCGAGDGLTLLSRIQGQSLKETASQLAEYLRLPTERQNEHKGVQKSSILKNTTHNQKENLLTERLNQAILSISDYFKVKELDYPVPMERKVALIPLTDIAGELTGLQFITPEGQKKYSKGTKKKGSFYVVQGSHQEKDYLNFKNMLPEKLPQPENNLLKNGELQTATRVNKENETANPQNSSKVGIIISEGVATAITIKLLFPDTLSIAALDAANLLTVGQAIRNKYPLASIIIAADNDTHLGKEQGGNKGVKWASKTAQAINASIAIPDTTDKADWNDLYVNLLNNGSEPVGAVKQLRIDFCESIKKEDFSDTIEISELADGTQLSQEELNRFQLMNSHYTQVILPDGALIYSKRLDGATGFYVLKHDKMNAFKARFDHEPQISRRNSATAWLKWKGKNYKSDGVGFFPNPDLCPSTVLNLFDGFAITPKQGDCSVYLDHIKNVLCSGDTVAYECFIAWLAHLFQKPEEKPSFAIVLASEQGAGKGISIQPILQILGCFGAYENGIERITGRFNSTIANKLLVFIDEVYISTAREADALKSLISETKVNIEQKGIDPIQTGNYTRYIFASNRLDAIRAGIRERRYLVLNVDSKHAQDKTYFDKLANWIGNNGAAYLLNYLLNYEIKHFDPRRAPQTKALNELILSRLAGIDGFIYEQLMSDNPFNILASISNRLVVKDLVMLYLDYAKENNEQLSKTKAVREIGDMFNRVFGVNRIGRSGRGLGILYEVSDIEELRIKFAEVRMRMKVGDLF